jgi:hypothetical protein
VRRGVYSGVRMLASDDVEEGLKICRRRFKLWHNANVRDKRRILCRMRGIDETKRNIDDDEDTRRSYILLETQADTRGEISVSTYNLSRVSISVRSLTTRQSDNRKRKTVCVY